jgi:hypothetical protein
MSVTLLLTLKENCISDGHHSLFYSKKQRRHIRACNVLVIQEAAFLAGMRRTR